jgi:hypothetical protein
MASGFLEHDENIKAHLVATWIEPVFRGRGIAEGLIRFISDWANIAGAEVLTAEVNLHNPRAQAFYRKIGFELLDEQSPLDSDPAISQVPIKKILKIKERHIQPNQSSLDHEIIHALEKRKHPRQDCLIPITFSFKERAYQEFIRNISRSGMYIESVLQISEGRDLTLSYHLPEIGPFKRVAKVIWANPGGMGVRFQ